MNAIFVRIWDGLVQFRHVIGALVGAGLLSVNFLSGLGIPGRVAVSIVAGAALFVTDFDQVQQALGIKATSPAAPVVPVVPTK